MEVNKDFVKIRISQGSIAEYPRQAVLQSETMHHALEDNSHEVDLTHLQLDKTIFDFVMRYCEFASKNSPP